MIKRILAGLLFVGGFAVVGFFFGGHTLNAVHGGINIEWQSVSLPAGHQPEHFSTGEGPYLYVNTDEGIRFAQLLRAGDPYAWERVDSRPLPGDPLYTHARATCAQQAREITERWMREPPVKIREYMLCKYMRHAEYTGEFHYVILEDDSIWRWVLINPGKAGLGLFVYYVGVGLLGGAAFGLVAFIGMLVIIRVLRSGSVQSIPSEEPITYQASASGILHEPSPGAEPQTPRSKGYSTLEKILALIIYLMVLGLTLWLVFRPLLSVFLGEL
ncbi:MAG: hypothetical protein GTO14_11160 [Anaerolineales bacterium]|nr:hypothetical protein [Anaerolineales bacterium]